jgi:hypothetical protein
VRQIGESKMKELVYNSAWTYSPPSTAGTTGVKFVGPATSLVEAMILGEEETDRVYKVIERPSVTSVFQLFKEIMPMDW